MPGAVVRGCRFANELFAIRCPILPIEGNEHWALLPGPTDIVFTRAETFPAGSPDFEGASVSFDGGLSP